MKLAVVFLIVGLLACLAHGTTYYDIFKYMAEMQACPVKKVKVEDIDFDGIQLTAAELRKRIKEIADTPQETFNNNEKHLPIIKGRYLEYRLDTNLSDKLRIVCVHGIKKWYYTEDHYESFYELPDVPWYCP